MAKSRRSYARKTTTLTGKTNGHRKLNNLSKFGIGKINGRKLAKYAALLSATKDARDTFTTVGTNVTKYAKTHPWKTMGLSVLAGVVIAEILHK